MDIVIHLSEHMKLFLSIMGLLFGLGLFSVTQIYLIHQWAESDLHGFAPVVWFLGWLPAFVWFVSGVQ